MFALPKNDLDFHQFGDAHVSAVSIIVLGLVCVPGSFYVSDAADCQSQSALGNYAV